jgi:phytoene desaturase
VQKALEASVLPGLGEHLRTSRIVTPLYFERELRSIKGAAFGLEPLLTQSAWFRPHNRSEDVRDLYFVGAGTHPGAGIPGVLSSAKALDSVLPMAEDYGRTRVPADRRRWVSPEGPMAPAVRPVARAAQSP